MLYVPAIVKNLFSVSSALKHDVHIDFHESGATIFKGSTAIGLATRVNGLFHIQHAPHVLLTSATSSVLCQKWHETLGHMNLTRMKHMAGGITSGLSKDILQCGSINCVHCPRGKLKQSSISKKPAIRATKLVELVHSDICGPISVESLAGARYFITFIDDKSRYCTVYFLTTKDEAAAKLSQFDSWCHRQIGHEIHQFRCDRGGEYTGHEFTDIVKERGIQMEHTAPHTPEHNGVAERRNGILFEGARSILSRANLSGRFWAKAVAFVNYVYNRSSIKALKYETPYQALFNKKPDLSNLHTFGCFAQVLIQDVSLKKTDARTKECVYLRPCYDGEGDRFYNPTTKKVFISRNAVFLDKFNVSISKPVMPEIKTTMELAIKNTNEESSNERSAVERVDLQTPEPERTEEPAVVEIDPPEDDQPNETEPTENPATRSVPLRTRAFPTKYRDYFMLVDVESITYKEAITHKDQQKWKTAMNAEMDALRQQEVWNLEPLPAGRVPISAKWVYKIKRTSEGSIERYKARLVARGFTQRKGIDYEETFAPVSKMTSLRTFLSIAAFEGFSVHQMDVNSAYLNGLIDVDIYMTQPEGYVSEKFPNHVCKLRKGLYGLKQAGRIWHDAINTYLISIGFTPSMADPCIYYHKSGTDRVYLCLYVDDIAVAGRIHTLNALKKEVAGKFSIRDLGQADFITGIQIRCSGKGISITQSTYVQRILSDLGYQNARTASIPISKRELDGLSIDQTETIDPTTYRNLVGHLTYAMTGMRPDIAFAISTLGRFSSQPTKQHHNLTRTTLCYLARTINTEIIYKRGGESLRLEGYVDSSYGSDKLDRRSVTGYVFLLNGSPISWASKRQSTIALSTTEAEYYAAVHASREAVWLRRLLEDLGYPQSEPTILHEDSQGCIAMTKNPVFHARTKHIDIQCHWIREKVKDREVELKYMDTNQQAADMLTKAVDKSKFDLCAELIELKRNEATVEGECQNKSTVAKPTERQ